MVSRWYGGVKLGGDRFRIINGVGRQAIVRLIEGEGRTVEGESTGKKKEGKKR